jgi:hypothetical protein
MRTIQTCRVLLITLILLIMPLVPGVPFVAAAEPESVAVLTVKASAESELMTRLELRHNRLFSKLGSRSVRSVTDEVPVTDTSLTIRENGAELTYQVDREGLLYRLETNERLELAGDQRKELVRYVEALRSAHFGQVVSWEKASGMIPKKTKFTVVDIETGRSFQVQRRAGKHHADVQPLTKEDTAIMKQIYNGKWSWKRKAILVKADNHLLAASMHGMPHGGDGIPDNNFSGHFCIHFLGSTTHGSGNVDPDHQLMVHKAGGMLEEYFAHASPYTIVEAYLNAFNMHDSQLLKLTFSNVKHHQLELLLDDQEQITGMRKRVKTVMRNISDRLSLESPVEVGITRKNSGEEKVTLLFQMQRASLSDPWRIAAIQMIS